MKPENGLVEFANSSFGFSTGFWGGGIILVILINFVPKITKMTGHLAPPNPPRKSKKAYLPRLPDRQMSSSSGMIVVLALGTSHLSKCSTMGQAPMAPGCSDWQHLHYWQIPWEVILRLIRLTHTLIHSVQAGKGATVRTVQNGGWPKYTSSVSRSRSTTGWNQFEVTFFTVLLRRNLNDKSALGAGTGSGQKLSTTWHRCSASTVLITHLHNSVGLGDAGFSLGTTTPSTPAA